VDLSAKAEQLLLDSAIAVANGISWVFLVPSSATIHLERWIVSKHGRKNFKYRVLAVLIYIAIKDHLGELDQIVIDQDYSGEQPQATIKNLLLQFLRRNHATVPAEFIRFGQIKGSRADILAKQVFDKYRIPERVVTWQEIVKVLGE
jgi:hypothetical protein